MSGSRWTGAWLSGSVAAVGLLALSVGCETTGYRGGGAVRDDVVAIRQFPPTYPWLKDEQGRISGMPVRVYFVSAQTGKGAFVPGVITTDLHVLERRADGTYERELAHSWSFDQRQAAGLRMQSPSILGDSYGLVLRWPAGLNLAGREVQLTFGYRRSDGRVITQPGSRFQVPGRAGAGSWSAPRSRTAESETGARSR